MTETDLKFLADQNTRILTELRASAMTSNTCKLASVHWKRNTILMTPWPFSVRLLRRGKAAKCRQLIASTF
jgi:hypothetical protein